MHRAFTQGCRRKALVRATGLLIGTWGLTYTVINRPVNLDAAPPSRRDESHNDKHSFTKPTLLTQSLVASQKPVSSFESSRKPIVDDKLHEFEQIHKAPPGAGISEYHVAETTSNKPSEDDHAEAILPVPSGYWSLFGVYDGHAGWETSAWLRENLIVAVVSSLVDVYDRFHREALDEGVTMTTPGPKDIETTFKDTFKDVDHHLIHERLQQVLLDTSRQKAVNTLAPGWAGSCALLSFYDSHSKILHTAITGDSRAILGRRVKDEDGKTSYSVHVLSTEQDGKNISERERLAAEHPGETVVKHDRVLGIAVSRAFGDGRWKWNVEEQKMLKEKYLGRSVLPGVKTPPYLTAEPEVTSIEIQPGDFLIMGTDGLWECLTSEDAVGLVGWWKDHSLKTSVAQPDELPVQPKGNHSNDGPRYGQWNAKKEFIKIDDNAATHLIRNALGGSNTDLAAALFSLRAWSRTFRDDITAVVVFFDDEKNAA
ncbi:hypothetical protein QCA50_017304 [Cerrena zonata]|uniref:PPM-type phosphatase domain-containing protein n=1 Tax=Cerrena zonata TaxID=2478898 RepID=A0AAW0FQ20_9APHY